MRITQHHLRASAADRVRQARPDLAEHYPLDTPADLAAVKEAVLAEPDGFLGVVVLRRADLASWAEATCAFALSLDPDTAKRWRRSLTRTIYLAGDPTRLRDRFSFAHLTEDHAWTKPAPAADSATLRRLLKTFEAPRELPGRPPFTLTIPTATATTDHTPTHRELHLATSGVPLSRLLVHLGHLLTEAAFDGLLQGGDRITVHQAPRLLATEHPFAALRVDTEDTGRLRLWAALTEPNPEDGPEKRPALPPLHAGRTAEPC
ncbi:DUF6182 family protein [Streptomyces sp. NPDC012825]|uniref:DUF6182 family protein n=1 Tax=Streptomyces sp. NPDC012825 TaxID=3364851 RepID=UPI003693CC0C